MPSAPADGRHSVRVRMAPSPTGPLHIGTARTSLYNYLFARHLGGTYVLRVEDTDAARGSDEFERDIIDNLHWLGINWSRRSWLICLPTSTRLGCWSIGRPI